MRLMQGERSLMRDIRDGGSGDITVCTREVEHKARAGCSHQVHGCIKGVIHRRTVGAGSECTAHVPEKKESAFLHFCQPGMCSNVSNLSASTLTY